MPKVVAALGRPDARSRGADRRAQHVAGATTRLPQDRFRLRKAVLDRIQVRTAFRFWTNQRLTRRPQSRGGPPQSSETTKERLPESGMKTRFFFSQAKTPQLSKTPSPQIRLASAPDVSGSLTLAGSDRCGNLVINATEPNSAVEAIIWFPLIARRSLSSSGHVSGARDSARDSVENL